MFAVIPTAVVLACSLGATANGDGDEAQKVLFIGNSLTYGNDVPGIVRALADSAGERLEVTMVAFPNFNLEDHQVQGDAERAISQGGWELVVLH